MSLFIISGYEFYGTPVKYVIDAKSENDAKDKLMKFMKQKYDSFPSIDNPSVFVVKTTSDVCEIFTS